MNAVPNHPSFQDLVPWPDVWRHSAIFKNREAASHFIQTRKARMVELGILFETVRGYLVNKPLFERHFLDLMNYTQPSVIEGDRVTLSKEEYELLLKRAGVPQ